jgi:aminoglycoside 6-adenylyltransferase
MTETDPIIQKLIRFGEEQDAIRAMLLTSSLCDPNAPSDILSDYDVEIYFDDPRPFVENDKWLETLRLGPMMALWHWPNEWDEEKGDGRTWTRMVYFQDGTKMDISLGCINELKRRCDLKELPNGYDIGYKILLDKDHVTGSLKSATYQAYILKPPSREHYEARIETFWMDSTYVAKYLWRTDIVAAKWRLHQIFDQGLREVLEWSVAIAHDWNWKPGALGRGLEKALDPATRTELLESFAGGDINDLWTSLFRTTALYRKTAIKVASSLGYNYPCDLDKRVTILHRSIMNLDRNTATREMLTELLKKGNEDASSIVEAQLDAAKKLIGQE